MQRRDFNRLCSGLLAGAAGYSKVLSASTQPFPRSALVYDDNSAVTVDSIEPGTSCIFSYPFVTTPCFVVRLKSAAVQTDQWHGGVGHDKSVVAR